MKNIVGVGEMVCRQCQWIVYEQLVLNIIKTLTSENIIQELGK